jgi:hypothetical protein
MMEAGSAATSAKTNTKIGDQHMSTHDKFIGLDVHKETIELSSPTATAMSSGGLRGCVRILRYRPDLRDEALNTLQAPPLLMSRCYAVGFFIFLDFRCS